MVTINNNLSKYVIPILKFLTYNEFTVKDTFNFVNKILEISKDNEFTMASFNVPNLFANVPPEEISNGESAGSNTE